MLEKKMKLPPVFKAKWIAALRSGKYKQGQGALCEETKLGVYKYCCLGVAEMVCGNRIENILDMGISEDLRKNSKVPKILKTPRPGSIIGLGDDFVDMNDTRKFSFKRIATFIEKNL